MFINRWTRFILVIAYMRSLCVKGSYLIFMFLFACADTELCIFVYIFFSTDGPPRLLLLAWMLMSCIIYSNSSFFTICFFLDFFVVNRVIGVQCHRFIIPLKSKIKIKLEHVFTLVIPKHWPTNILLSDFLK